MKFLFPVMVLVLLLLDSVAMAKRIDPLPETETLVTRTRGHCVITVPKKNDGILALLSGVCTNDVPRIYRQLGVNWSSKEVAPITIRVVSHPSDMHRLAPPGTSLPLWSGAVAFPTQNLVMLPLQRMDGGPSEDLEVTLVHEISHVAFRAASGGAVTPRWFSEGVAILQSEGSSFHRSQSIWWASLIDDIRPLKEIEKYPEGAKSAEQAYAQAADFTTFLIEREGWNGIRFLLAAIRDGSSFDDAFRQSYGQNVNRLEKKWREELFGGMGWLMHVTGDGMWLGLGALICIVGFFLVRRRKKQRLKEMEEEEAHLEKAIASLDELIVTHPGALVPKVPMSPVMDRVKKQRTKVEVDGKFHTLH
ncbi:MAG: hypothetical protein JXR76_29685 [Deltaproteobacteria bacterium]|nr:hypothetical protein [Deltaproteobacteria bacterium]